MPCRGQNRATLRNSYPSASSPPANPLAVRDHVELTGLTRRSDDFNVSRTLRKRRKELISRPVFVFTLILLERRASNAQPPLPPFATNPLSLPSGKVSSRTATPVVL